MNKSNKSAIPSFRDEKEERIFWEKNDAADYFDLSKAKRVTLPNLKPTKASEPIKNDQRWAIALKGSILEPNGV